MEPENYNQEPAQTEQQVEQPSSLHQVTPLSKYLAMALFIILPFLGGYVGYVYAPERVVERVAVKRVPVEQNAEAEKEISTERQGSVESDQNSEVWHLKTSFGKEFLAEPNDFFLRGSYELLDTYKLAGFEYMLHDTEKANLESHTFFVVATSDDEHAFFRISTRLQTAEKLTTLASKESDYAPGLALGNNDQGMIFLFPSCTRCAPVILDKAVYLIDKNDYQTIGTTSKFEWIDGGYRYKSIPEGCDATFNATYEPTPSEICEQKADSLDWVVVTP